MIQYPISQEQLEQRLEQEHPGWLARARERTENFAALGHYQESSSIWSEVKVVYMRLQHGKCAYCERQLESAPPVDLIRCNSAPKGRFWLTPQVISMTTRLR